MIWALLQCEYRIAPDPSLNQTTRGSHPTIKITDKILLFFLEQFLRLSVSLTLSYCLSASLCLSVYLPLSRSLTVCLSFSLSRCLTVCLSLSIPPPPPL